MAQRVKNMRLLLIEAGIQEINRSGVSDFSVRQVAEVCGVSCAAPYKHFKDKREFIHAIIGHVNGLWGARQAEILARYEGSLRAQIVAVTLGYVRFLMDNPCYRRILMLKDAEYDNIYHKGQGQQASRSQQLEQAYHAESGLDEAAWRRKLHMVRALMFGTLFLMNTGELPYTEETMENLRLGIEGEFDRP